MTPRRDIGVAASCIVVALWASSAPTMLYPEYHRLLGLDLVATTALFAVYPGVLLVGLLVTGGLSDRAGRGRTLALGLGLVGVGAALSLVPANVPVLFGSRALEGVGVALVLPAANAWLGDVLDSRPRGARLASTINASAAATGTVAAFMVGAVLVDRSPAAGLLSQWPLLLSALLGCVTCLRWGPPATGTGNSRPALPALPDAPDRLPFWGGTAAASAGYAITAVFLSLGAHIGRELTASPGAVADAASLALFPLATAFVPWLTVALPERACVVFGGGAGALGMLTLLGVGRGGGAAFTIAALLSGAGFGLLTRAGTALVHRSSPADRRAGGLATMSVAMYAAQAATALTAGAAAQAHGLRSALTGIAPVVAAVAIATVIATRRLPAPRSAHRPTARPSPGCRAPRDREHADA
jgi:MFS family permease